MRRDDIQNAHDILVKIARIPEEKALLVQNLLARIPAILQLSPQDEIVAAITTGRCSMTPHNAPGQFYCRYYDRFPSHEVKTNQKGTYVLITFDWLPDGSIKIDHIEKTKLDKGLIKRRITQMLTGQEKCHFDWAFLTRGDRTIFFKY